MVYFGFSLLDKKKSETSEPYFFYFFLKRPQVNIHLNPAFAFVILWYLPQVLIAGTASTILEFIGFKHISCFIKYFDFCSGNDPVIFCYEVPVLLACLTDNGKTYIDS